MSSPSEDTRTAVLEYYRLVADLTGDESRLAAIIDPAVRITEHPNLITPRGAVRDLAASLAGRRAGRELLAEQAFDVHEVLVDGDRAAVRATWSGVTGIDRGPLPAGTRLTAEVAAFLTVRDGRIVEHETFDCYPPFGT